MSYASDDAAVAQRLCDALQADGIEVWFDRGELRGGDAWDAAIRGQIKACALFMPVISAHSQARAEGYFRLEWKLAVDRSYLMAIDRPFLVPVAIDDTSEIGARVPDRFREVQWIRLPDGAVTPELAVRVRRLLVSLAGSGAPPPGPAVGARSTAELSRGPDAPMRTRAAQAPPARWWWKGILFAAAVVAIAGIGYQAFNRSPASTHVTARKDLAATAGNADGAIPEKSIAVLPFIDMSEHHDQEYFSDGLAEELLDLLAQVPDLRVPARTSSFYFKGKTGDIAAIAQRLKVAHVLEGSVRKSGSTVRVTAQLIRTDSGYHLWSQSYDRDMKDIFKVQDEIANAVVEALKAKLRLAQPLSNRHRTQSTAAYTEYLLGNRFRSIDTRAANDQALDAYRKAVALDPTYAAAWSGVSAAEWRIADQTTAEAAGYQRAADAAAKAIELAPELPDGYWARGLLRNNYFFDWQGAAADYRRALELDPNFVTAKVDYACLLATLGRPAEALAEVRAALALDPLSPLAWRRLSEMLTDGGQYVEARRAATRVLEVTGGEDPRQHRAFVALFAGDAAAALEEFRVGRRPFAFVGIAMSEHTLGRDSESRRALQQLIEAAGTTLGYQIAQVYAWRGEKDRAFEWLERAYRAHDGGLSYLPTDRAVAGLRGDPRYASLLRKLNLPTPPP